MKIRSQFVYARTGGGLDGKKKVERRQQGEGGALKHSRTVQTSFIDEP